MSLKLASVEDQYKKDKNIKKADVQLLIEWLQKQPHLPQATELQIIFFLHSCQYRVELAKNTIDQFFTLRTLWPEIFHCPQESVIRQALSVGFVSVLPERTPDGNLVIMTKLLDLRPENYVHINQITLIDMVTLLHLYENGIFNGLRVVIDMQGSVFGHMTRCNLPAVKKHFYYLQEAVPTKIKGLHFINLSSFIDALLNMVKPLISKEIMDIVNLHSTLESLYKYVPKDLLPEDYGGKAPPISTLYEKNLQHILENQEFFKSFDAQSVDESKRLEKNTKLGQVFGVEGTFKKLEVD